MSRMNAISTLIDAQWIILLQIRHELISSCYPSKLQNINIQISPPQKRKHHEFKKHSWSYRDNMTIILQTLQFMILLSLPRSGGM